MLILLNLNLVSETLYNNCYIKFEYFYKDLRPQCPRFPGALRLFMKVNLVFTHLAGQVFD